MLIRYSKYEATLDDLDMADLMNMISERLLESGFNTNPWDPDPNSSMTMEELYAAIAEAMINNELVNQDIIEQAFSADDWLDSELGEIAKELANRLEQEGFLNPMANSEEQGQGGLSAETNPNMKFELTNKSIDFLGYKTLRDVLGASGSSSLGQHSSNKKTTGVEAIAETKSYEFGDAMNLNITETFKNAAKRGFENGKLNLDYGDLEVIQAEYKSSAATVVMLDCSHSMILYGEDRFLPAKQVALALAHMIKTEYKSDSIKFVLFHNSAEEIPLSKLAMVQVGPYHTNTAAGLRLAQKILKRQNKDMKQIIMITDGKPSAITLPNGQVYKNAFGLDPIVMSETIKEVASCRRQGIQINTFMLANDPELISFVQRISHMTKGKAYFTSPRTIGRYVLQDFNTRRTKIVN
ncbi:MAG TPA: VWA domain-containing protein [Trueperaceae bacterium]|nr:VWA domain-containing protein [Trueperaceae bacterium]